MRTRTLVIFPVLTLALILAAALLLPQWRAGAQGPEGTDGTDALEVVDLIDVGPAPETIREESDSPTTQTRPEDDGTVNAASHTTNFTYQGRLTDGGQPANGAYDFRFLLYDADVGGSQIGGLITEDDVAVSDGLFTVVLDFGSSAFTGSSRYLEIGVRPGDSTGTFLILAPRRRVTPTPYASFAYNANQLDGRDASSFASANHDHDDRYFRKRINTQFNGTLNAGQTRSYFTFGWPTDEVVYWSMHPTTTNGRVDWTVDIRLADNGRFIYYLTVTNTGSDTTSFAAKYVIFR